jgi:ketosteroid isomerase-like protein
VRLSFVVSILICLAALASESNAAPGTKTSASAPDEFIALEKVWNEAHLKGDASILERLWSDDLQVIVPKMPVMTKSEVIAFARSGRMKFEQYATSHINVRRFGETAVVTGQMKRSRSLDGQSVDDNWQFTKVYLRKAGRWQVFIFQASEAPGT